MSDDTTASGKPSPTATRLEGIPECLRGEPVWVNYDANKVPKPRITSELLTFEAASKRKPARIGYVFRAKYGRSGIDLDADTHADTATRLLDWARSLGAYIERSLSGQGWHIIGRGALQGAGVGKRSTPYRVEAYSQGRYFTVTGQGDGDPDVSVQPLLDWIESYRETSQGSPRGNGETDALWDPAVHQGALDAVSADCDYDTWIRVGMALHAGGAGLEVFDAWSATALERYPPGGIHELESHWRSFRTKPDGVTLDTLLWMAREAGYGEGSVEDFDVLPEIDVNPPKPTQTDETTSKTDETRPNPWENRFVAAHTLVTEPPVRSWAWDQWLPHGVVTGLAGPPGIAKSTFALQLAVHHCLGLALLGAAAGPGAVAYVTVEDDLAELHRRFHQICHATFTEPRNVPGLYLAPVIDVDTTLVHIDRDGKAKVRIKALRECLIKIKARVLVLDLIGDFWDGNENARAEVSAYVRQLLGRLASHLDLAILAISHPSKATTDGFSGSTAWLGSYRSAITMERIEETDSIQVSRVKANYAGLDASEVRWTNGYLVEIPQAERQATQTARRLAMTTRLPADVWVGIDGLRERWNVSRREARQLADAMVEADQLEQRRHAGAEQWKVTQT